MLEVGGFVGLANLGGWPTSGGLTYLLIIYREFKNVFFIR